MKSEPLTLHALCSAAVLMTSTILSEITRVLRHCQTAGEQLMSQHINDVCWGAVWFAPMLLLRLHGCVNTQCTRFRPNHFPGVHQCLCPLNDCPRSGFRLLLQEEHLLFQERLCFWTWLTTKPTSKQSLVSFQHASAVKAELEETVPGRAIS